MTSRISQKTMISPRAAKDLIMTMAIWGNDYNYRLKTEKEVSDFFARQGISISQLIAKCRVFSNAVPNVENLIGPTYHVSAGAKIAKVNLKTNEEEFTVQGPGEYTTSDYWRKFDSADKSLKHSIESASYEEFQTALTKGIASIESYLTHRALEWNRNNPLNPIDLRTHLSLDEKIDQWIPIMLNGTQFNKGRSKSWSDYQLLKPIRDNIGIHAKQSASGINYQDLVKLQNLYRSGIAGLLMDLHKLFKERMPAVIIRRYYAPDVVYQE